MNALMITLVVLPLAMTVASAVLPRRAREIGTLVVGIISFGCAIALVEGISTRRSITDGPLRIDALSVVFLLATAALYAGTALYAIGYVSKESHLAEHAGGDRAKYYDRYLRRFYMGVNAFAWSMLCAPLVNSMALLWVAIEITTVVSALLVAVDSTEGATEAAWKYVLIASCGLGVALLATIMVYYAGAQVFGNSYDLSIDPLLRAGGRLPGVPLEFAFVLAVVGFGTKVGLFPVHTWLPDAHSEAPTPVSVLLSGALLATSFYAILRFYQITAGAVGSQFPRTTLLIFGVLSLLLAALYLFDQQNLKRMLAYSSIEHMGILAIGIGFGTPLAFTGVLLHVLAHAAAKGSAFMGAGVLVRKFGTKDLNRMRGALDKLPWSGPLFLLAVFALGALPPTGIFRSEFEIIAGGIDGGHTATAAILVALVTLAFFGLTLHTTYVLFASPVTGHTEPRGEPSITMVIPIIAGIAALLLLGLHPPDAIAQVLSHGAAELNGVNR